MVILYIGILKVDLVKTYIIGANKKKKRWVMGLSTSVYNHKKVNFTSRKLHIEYVEFMNCGRQLITLTDVGEIS